MMNKMNRLERFEEIFSLFKTDIINRFYLHNISGQVKTIHSCQDAT